jgi:hypothetical protein
MRAPLFRHHRRVRLWVVAALLAAFGRVDGSQAPQPLPSDRPRSPIVIAIGCAAEGPAPHVWVLSRATPHVESTELGLTAAEKAQLSAQPLGPATYQLIGIADFVDAATAAKIGARGQVMAPSRMNTTGALAAGRKVGVKGLLIEGSPPRINLTSVADLGRCSQ